MRPRVVRIVAALATLVAVLACSSKDGIPPTSAGRGAIARSSDSTLLAGLNVSGPVANAGIAPDRGAVSASVAPSAEVSYVSLVPGTVADGTTATIANLRTAQRDTVPIVDGGFDPQPIPANLGDTLQVTVSRTGSTEVAAYTAVADRRGPRIVRSRPPRGQTDAPLNTIITLVFSEPLDPASVNATTVTLTTAGAPVAGAIRVMSGPGYAVEFTPTALLTPGTAYSVTVNGIVNLSGTPLAEPVSIPFTTSATTGSGFGPLSDTLTLFQNVGVVIGDTIRLQPYVFRGPIISTEALEWTISDSSVASIRLLGDYSIAVQALRSGVVTVSVRTLGSQRQLSARASLKVYGRSSQPSPIVVEEFSILEQVFPFSAPISPSLPFDTEFVYVPNLRLRDTSATHSTRVVGVTIDLPGSDHPRMYCAPNYALGAESWSVFAPPSDEDDVQLSRRDYQRFPDLTVNAVARVSAVLSDSLGVSFAFTGRIVPNYPVFTWSSPGMYNPPCTPR